METMESYYHKVHTRTDYILAAAIFVFAVLLFFIHKGIGITVAICSGLLLLFQRSGFIFEGHKDVLRMKSYDLCGICRPALMAFLDGKDPSATLQEGSTGGTVRLELFYSESSAEAFVRVYDFVDYVYVPTGPIIQLTRERAEKLMAQLSH